jgi:uncharacterized membrane protein
MSVDAGPYADERETAPPLARMAIAVLALIGLLVATYLSLYKLGVIGGLTCQVGSCEQVQASPWAVMMGIPVSLWGVGAYVTLLFVAILGLQPSFVHARWVPWMLFGVSAMGVLYSGYLTYVEAFVIEMWCQWCVTSAVIVTLIFLLSIPGLRRAEP